LPVRGNVVPVAAPVTVPSVLELGDAIVEPAVTTVATVVVDVLAAVVDELKIVVPSTSNDVVVVAGAVVVVVLVDVEVVVDSVVVVDSTVVVVSGAVVVVSSRVVVVSGAVVVVSSTVVVVGGAVVVVVVDPPSPSHTCVRLNVESSSPPTICAVALKSLSVSGTLTLANLSLTSTVPETVPAVWNVADRLTNASPWESGSTKIHPGPCAQLCTASVPTVPT
jgi:hypothetical protein